MLLVGCLLFPAASYLPLLAIVTAATSSITGGVSFLALATTIYRNV